MDEQHKKEIEARELATKFINLTSKDTVTCDRDSTVSHFHKIVAKHGLPTVLIAMDKLDRATLQVMSVKALCHPQVSITPIELLTNCIISGGEEIKSAVETLTNY